MPKTANPYTKRKFVYSLAVFLFVLAGLLYLRQTADGIRNALSINYWLERRAGFDLYNPETHYFKRGSRSHQDLLLTFDDAPRGSSTAQILDTLKTKHVAAAFFVIGKRVKEKPELVMRMILEGNEVGNHTQDHLRLDTLTEKQVNAELQNCELNVERATGRKMTLFRPPGMRLNPTVKSAMKGLGYTLVGWSIGAKDFIPDQQITDMSAEESKNLRVTPDEVADRIIRQAKSGEIVLLHDNPVTAVALPKMIDSLRSKGFSFITTAQMLAELPHPVPLVANPKVDKKSAALKQ